MIDFSFDGLLLCCISAFIITSDGVLLAYLLSFSLLKKYKNSTRQYIIRFRAVYVCTHQFFFVTFHNESTNKKEIMGSGLVAGPLTNKWSNEDIRFSINFIPEEDFLTSF